MPLTAALDIGSAPRKIEIWGEMLNSTQRAFANEYLDQDDYPKLYERPPPSKREAGIALGDKYVRLGEMIYDVRNPNHVQTRRLSLDTERFGIPIKKIVVRAVTNWGREFTCLYRVRMHGKIVQKEPDWVSSEDVLQAKWINQKV